MTALHKACKHISSPWALVNAKSFFFFLVIRNTLKDPSLNRHFSAEKKKEAFAKKAPGYRNKHNTSWKSST